MRAWNDFHAAHLRGCIGQRQPDGYQFVRIQPEIGGILMPGHIGAVLSTLDPEPGRKGENIGSDQILDHIENAVVKGEIVGPPKTEMAISVFGGPTISPLTTAFSMWSRI